MRLKTFFSFLFAVLLGAAVAVVIKVGYVLPGILPTSDIFIFLIESPLGRFALAKRGGEGGVLIAIAMRAFPYSVIAGAIAGAVLTRLRFKRAFCYSALWLPISNVVLGYLDLSSASISNPESVVAMQKQFGQVVWTNLWVFGWYFLALYLSFIVTSRMILRSTGPAGKAAQVG